MLDLNQQAHQLAAPLQRHAEQFRAQVHQVAGAQVVDLGVNTPGGLEAGRRLAQVCLSGLGRVELLPGGEHSLGLPLVAVASDQPLWACMGSQYAGWQITGGGFFAMGSGPMRLLAGKEELLAHYELRQQSSVAVGVLESGSLPPEEVCRQVAQSCGVEPQQLTLLVAPTTSLAGTFQVVARSLETALHKLHELGFPLTKVQSGWGAAPLVPPASEFLPALGRTNDAILYAAQVVLWIDAGDEELEAVVGRVPSSASADYGEPFAQIFQRHGGDFYQIDPLLFSPAVVTLHSLQSGRTFRAGRLNLEVLRRSLEG